MSVSLLYVTTADRAEALRIGRTLVEEQLVACANVMDGMTSVYRWEGEIEQSDESVLLLKTRTELVKSVISRVCVLHTYDVPCVVSWPIDSGNRAYLEWIHSETPSWENDM